MERTITYEGARWRVWVNPTTAGRGSHSGLELVFTAEADERRVVSPVGPPLLRILSQEGLELEESILREELREVLGGANPGGVGSAARTASETASSRSDGRIIERAETEGEE